MRFSGCAHAAAILLLGAAGHATAADCVNGINATGSCTVPAGVTRMTIEAWGGGGGGGSNDMGANNTYYGGSGGGAAPIAKPSCP